MQKMSELFFLALPHLVEFLWKLPLKTFCCTIINLNCCNLCSCNQHKPFRKYILRVGEGGKGQNFKYKLILYPDREK